VQWAAAAVRLPSQLRPLSPVQCCEGGSCSSRPVPPVVKPSSRRKSRSPCWNDRGACLPSAPFTCCTPQMHWPCCRRTTAKLLPATVQPTAAGAAPVAGVLLRAGHLAAGDAERDGRGGLCCRRRLRPGLRISSKPAHRASAHCARCCSASSGCMCTGAACWALLVGRPCIMLYDAPGSPSRQASIWIPYQLSNSGTHTLGPSSDCSPCATTCSCSAHGRSAAPATAGWCGQ
jgi:hypothetical protein